MNKISHGAQAKGARIAVAMAGLAIASASHATTTVITAPDFTGTDLIVDTTTAETVAGFSFASIPSADITSLTISGAWGNAAQYPGSLIGSANTSLFADGIEIATCHQYDLCYANKTAPVGWSYTFTEPQIASLGGNISLVAMGAADGDGYVYGSNVLSGMKLTVSAVPEPASVALMLAGLGIVGLKARRSRA